MFHQEDEEENPINENDNAIQVPPESEASQEEEEQKTMVKEEPELQLQQDNNQKSRSTLYFIIIVVILTLIGVALFYFYQEAQKQWINQVDLTYRKYDSREYKLVQLRNDMKVLVIQDKDLEEAAIAVNVGVGSYSAPDDFPGLAHFLEHMLFMGSGKYPDVHEFPDFITTNDGNFNAYTAAEQTNFFFSVPYNAFDQGMDIFSRFFIDPLLSQENINSEIDAITNEFEIELTHPGWQSQFALQQIANKSHPYSHFQCGNRDSLMITPSMKGKNVYNAMQDFYRQHYSSNIMSLVVISKEDTEKMLDTINNKFGEVKNKQLDATSFKSFNNSGKMFGKTDLGSVLKYISSSSDYTLVIAFELEEIITKYNEQPLDYIDYFISHDGEKSLKQVLKEKGLFLQELITIYRWIYNIDSGSNSDTSGVIYEVEFVLSEEGTKQISEILQLFYSYLDLIKKEGVTEKNYEQVRQMANLTFQYSEKFDILNEAHTCAANMQRYPLELALLGQSLFKKFDEKLIKSYLNYMTPENAIYMFCSSKFGQDEASGDKKEKEEEEKDDEKKKESKKLLFQLNKINTWNKKKVLIMDQIIDKKSNLNHESILKLIQLKYQQQAQNTTNYTVQSKPQVQQINKTNFLRQTVAAPTSQPLPTIAQENQQQLTVQKTGKMIKPEKSDEQEEQEEEEKPKEPEVELDFFNTDLADDTWKYNSLYKLSFINRKLSQSALESLSKESSDASKLALPTKNSFVPSDVELIPTCKHKSKQTEEQEDKANCVKETIKDDENKDSPNLIIMDDKMEVWHKLDRSFKLPKVSMELQFSSPIVCKSEENIAISKVFTKLLNDQISQELNDAITIGYEIQVLSSLSGINIEVYGFREKFSLVIKTISTLINDFKCDKQKLELIKEELQKSMEEDLQDVTSQAISNFKVIMLTPSANATSIKDKIADIDEGKVMEFKEKVFAKGFVTGICIGNILEEEVKTIFKDNFRKIINYKAVSNFDQLYEYKLQISKLKNRSIVIRMPNLNKKDDNSLLLNYYQIGLNNMQSSKDFENFIKLHILQNILHSESFSILRTEMQLGYSVGAFLLPLDNVDGIAILIQGSKNLPDKNDLIVEQVFLQKVEEIINDLSIIEFELIKESIKSQLVQKDQKLKERKDRYFSIINQQLYDFTILNSIVKALDLLTLQNLQNYYKEIFKTKTGRISYQIFANSEKGKINKEVSQKKMYTKLKSEVYYENEKIKKLGKFQRREIQQLKSKLKQFDE